MRHESSRILRDELRERGKGEEKRAATSSVVRLQPFSIGKQQKRKGFHPLSFALHLGETSEESAFTSFPGKTGQRSPEPPWPG
jgi:hypothetical protein